MDKCIYEVTGVGDNWIVTHSMGRMPFGSRRAAIKSAVDAAHRDQRQGRDVAVRVLEADGTWSDLHLF